MSLNMSTNIKTISKQEKIWIHNMCDDIYNSHFDSNTHIKHYACIVRHGRGKSQREKGGSW